MFKLFRWVLSILFALICFGMLVSGQFLAFIIALLSLVFIFPPIQELINSRLPFLKSGFLKLFLSVVAMIMALSTASGNSVAVRTITVCSQVSENQCDKQEIAFLEKTNKIHVSATLNGANLAKQVQVTMDYEPEPDSESQVLDKTFDIPQNQEEFSLTLDQLNLKPGGYRLTLRPVDTGKKEPLSKDHSFSVWTTPDDVAKRNEGDVENAGVAFNSVSNVKICEVAEDAKKGCDQDVRELSSQVKYLAFSADIPNFGTRVAKLRGDSEITFSLRYLGTKDKLLIEPIQVFRKTSALEDNVGTYTLSIPAPDEGLPVGDFELLTALETRSSQPVITQFSIQ